MKKVFGQALTNVGAIGKITACTIVACFFFVKTAMAQPYRQLTADDFQGRPRSEGGIVAYTNCSIDFRYEAIHQRDIYRLRFTITLKVNADKSWLDRRKITSHEMLLEILKHEQGHYTIAYMEQQELIREVTKTVFHADYQTVAQQIFDRIDAKYKQLNYNYDEDTQHMVNRVQQHSWDMYFKQRLEFMPPA